MIEGASLAALSAAVTGFTGLLDADHVIRPLSKGQSDESCRLESRGRRDVSTYRSCPRSAGIRRAAVCSHQPLVEGEHPPFLAEVEPDRSAYSTVKLLYEPVLRGARRVQLEASEPDSELDEAVLNVVLPSRSLCLPCPVFELRPVAGAAPRGEPFLEDCGYHRPSLVHCLKRHVVMGGHGTSDRPSSFPDQTAPSSSPSGAGRRVTSPESSRSIRSSTISTGWTGESSCPKSRMADSPTLRVLLKE